MTASDYNPTLNEPFTKSHFESLPHAACVSLFHRSGRVGCGTYSRTVMTGRLLDWNSVVSSDDDDENNNNNENGNDNDVRRGLHRQQQQQQQQHHQRKLLEGATTIPPYVAVMDEQYYTDENVAQLILYAQNYAAGDDYGEVEEGGPLRGILVLKSTATAEEFAAGTVQFPSPEPLAPQGDDTPSAKLSVGSSYEWNANNSGDGLTDTDLYGLPTAYVADEGTANYLRTVSVDQADSLASNDADDAENAVYPSILSEFNYYMGPGGEVNDGADGSAAYDSRTCLEWKDADGEWSPRCAPLGGNSVWAVAGSPAEVGYDDDYGNANNDNNADENADDNADETNKRPVILVATSIDATSMFHDLSPGANTAASNTLTLLMAAHLLGSSVNDETLDALASQIAFGFFQGESYGYIGSRRFLTDVVEGFECAGGNEGVASVYKKREDGQTTRGCLYPARADLTFQNLGQVKGMIAVDQAGNLGGAKNMYVHGGEGTDGGNGMAGFIGEVALELSANDEGGYVAQASSAEAEDGVTPLPPTPLSSLVSLSGSAVGGVVLAGYDDAFVANSLYHSHLDSTAKGFQTIDKDAIASAATLTARTAIAAAYQNENAEVDAETAAAYALQLIPNAVDPSSETFNNLYACLFENGNCQTFIDYGAVERSNEASRTGTDLGMGVPLGNPPNYYTSIYDSNNGQAFILASGKYYGALAEGETDKDGEVVKNYGDDEKDAFFARPSLLEMSILGMLNDFLGRGSFAANDDGSDPKLATCKKSDDCSSVSYCDSESSALAVPTCAGGTCVCGARSHYHPALDEALTAAANVGPGKFEIVDTDAGISALYTEPYWSSYVGVRIYNDAGNNPGVYASSVGAVFALACLGFVWRLKKTMVKEKVY